MADFSFVHELPMDVDTAWSISSSNAYNQALFEKNNLERELLSEHTEDGVVYRELQFTSRRHLPAFLRRILGGDFGYRESVTMMPDQRRLEVDIVPSVLGARTTFQAELRFDPVAADRCTRTFRGTLTVRMALVGRRIERAILSDIEDSHETAVELLNEFAAVR